MKRFVTRREPTKHGQVRWVSECPYHPCTVEKASDSRSKAQGKMRSHIRDAHRE